MGLFSGCKKGCFRLIPVVTLLFALVLIGGCSSGSADKSKKAEAEDNAPTVDNAVNQGKLHFDAGIQGMYEKKYDRAIEEFEKSLGYNPHSPSTLNNIGFAYYDKGDMDKAVEYHARALDNDPSFTNAYFGLALTLEGMGQKEGALKNWKEFLKRTEPGSKWAQKARKHIDKLEEAAK